MNSYQLSLIMRFGPEAIAQAQQNCRKCRHWLDFDKVRVNPCTKDLLPISSSGPGCPYFEWAEGMKA